MPPIQALFGEPVSADRDVIIAQEFFRLDELQKLVAAMSVWLKGQAKRPTKPLGERIIRSITFHCHKYVSNEVVAAMSIGPRNKMMLRSSVCICRNSSVETGTLLFPSGYQSRTNCACHTNAHVALRHCR